MKNRLLGTGNHLTGFILRCTIVVVLLPHGLQHTVGLFGGHGFTATMDTFTGLLHLPWIIAFLTICLQIAGPLSMLLGLASRLFAFALIILFIGMILTAHLENGFFMNWFGNQKGEGFEYHLLVIGILGGILAGGAGRYSLDRRLVKQ